MIGKVPTFRRCRSSLLCSVLLLGTLAPAWALITGGFGNDPIQNHQWPDGSLDVANLKTRVGWWEGPPIGGGEYQFLYRGDTKALNEALEALSKINAPSVEVAVHAGPHDSFWLEDHDRSPNKDSNKPKRDPRVDWEFTVWTPRSYHRLYNHPNTTFMADQPNFRKPIPAPRIDVYIGGGQVEWKDVKVPDNVRLIDHRSKTIKDGNAAEIAGRVYNATTSRPVIGATISVVKRDDKGKNQTVQTAVTDTRGVYRVPEFPGGTYTVWVSADGLAPRDLGWKQLDGGTSHKLITYLCPSVKVEGVVKNDKGEPVEGAKIHPRTMLGIDGLGYAMPERPDVTTDDQGKFELELPEGSAYFSCHKPQLHQKEFMKLYDIPATDLELRMERTTKVSIKLLDSKGFPVTGKSLSLEPKGDPIGKWGGSANTDEKGEVNFEGVPPGEYVISSDGSNAKETKAVTISAGDPKEFTLKMK